MKVVLIALKVAITFALIFYIVNMAGVSTLTDSLSQLRLEWALAAAVLFLLQIVFSAWRWHLLMRDQDVHISLIQCLKFYYASYFIGMVMPATLGIDAARIKLLMSHNIPTGAAARTVLKDRLFTVGSVLFMAVISLPILIQLMGRQGSQAITGLAAAVLFLIALVAMTLYGERLWARIPWAGKHLALVATETRTLLKNWKMAWKVLVLGILSQALVIVQFWCFGQALDFHAPWSAYFSTLPAVTILTMLPITLNGWGMRETTFYKGMALIGYMSPLTVTMSIAYGLMSIVVALGAAPLFLRFLLDHRFSFRAPKNGALQEER